MCYNYNVSMCSFLFAEKKFGKMKPGMKQFCVFVLRVNHGATPLISMKLLRLSDETRAQTKYRERRKILKCKVFRMGICNYEIRYRGSAQRR
jgi:hypothetical protein